MSDAQRVTAGYFCLVLIALGGIAYDAAVNACLIQSPDFAGTVRNMMSPAGSPTPIDNVEAE